MRWPDQWQKLSDALLRWRDQFEASVNSWLRMPARSGLRTTTAIATGLAMVVSGLVACTLQLAVGESGRQGQPAAGASASTSLPANPNQRPSARERGDGFAHPGILVSQQQLDYVRDRLSRRMEPWASAFEEMASSKYASLSWQARPRAVVECGGYSIPDLGCRDETEDGLAAYTHALMWSLTGRGEHAEKATEIVDAWSAVLLRHTNSNAQLQAGWAGATLARAAELMRYTYPEWSPERIARVERMFRTAFVPLVAGGAPTKGGNWELITLDAAVGLAVFLNDRSLFDRALARFRVRVPAFVYLTTDGPLPRSPNGPAPNRAAIMRQWYGQQTFVNGLTQETCRDLGHTGWGLSAMAHLAETARLQGVDIYAEIRQRFVSAIEFHVPYELGTPVPSWLCGGKLNLGLHPAPEIAYHHYALRMGGAMPATERFMNKRRPEGASYFYGWETLTHADNAF